MAAAGGAAGGAVVVRRWRAGGGGGAVRRRGGGGAARRSAAGMVAAAVRGGGVCGTARLARRHGLCGGVVRQVRIGMVARPCCWGGAGRRAGGLALGAIAGLGKVLSGGICCGIPLTSSLHIAGGVARLITAIHAYHLRLTALLGVYVMAKTHMTLHDAY